MALGPVGEALDARLVSQPTMKKPMATPSVSPIVAVVRVKVMMSSLVFPASPRR
jgi:hypothetical protein